MQAFGRRKQGCLFAGPCSSQTLPILQAVTIDVADLEEDASPEDIMLSYVSGDKSKVGTDLELMVAFCRFHPQTHLQQLLPSALLRIAPTVSW
jgi:hypothetical protein